MSRYWSSDLDQAAYDCGTDKKRVYKLSEVADRIRKVAFDVVRFSDSDSDSVGGLWKIEQSPDGPVIVAMYEVPEVSHDTTDMKKEAANHSAQGRGDWSVYSSGISDLNVFYKGEPIDTIKTASYGVETEEDLRILSSWLPGKLSSDSSFRKAFIKNMSSDLERRLIIKKFPELVG